MNFLSFPKFNLNICCTGTFTFGLGIIVEIPQWISDPYRDIEETDVILHIWQLTKNLRYSSERDISSFGLRETYPIAWKFLIDFQSLYSVKSGCQSTHINKRNRLGITDRGDVKLNDSESRTKRDGDDSPKSFEFRKNISFFIPRKF